MLCCRAIDLTEQLAPGTLEASPSVLLRLHIQIFIELVSCNLLLWGHALGPMYKVHNSRRSTITSDDRLPDGESLLPGTCLTPLPLHVCQVRQKQDSAALEYGHQVLKPICNSSGDRELLSEAVTLLGSATCLTVSKRRRAVHCAIAPAWLAAKHVLWSVHRYHEPALSPLGHLLSERHKLVLASDLNRAILSHQARTLVHREQDVQSDLIAMHSVTRQNGAAVIILRLTDQRLLQGGQEKSPLERLMRQLVGDWHLSCAARCEMLLFACVGRRYRFASTGCHPTGAASHKPPGSGSH